jgi:hypothetical protein
MIEGRCLCGTVRYELEGPVASMLHCHCSMCRKHHGTPYATWAAAPLAGFRYTSGEASIARYASSPGFHRSFCTICGSVVPESLPSRDMVICPAGNLQGDLGCEPSLHMFVGSKAPWYEITDDLPRFDEYPPQFGMKATARPAVETSDDEIRGSCLCGEVAYTISGPPLRMFYCHCSRCRLARSAAYAANAFYKADGLRWPRGADLVQDYALPGAKFFGAAFCRRCGSALPRVSVERNAAVVPVGSLDTDPGMLVQGHIFVDSMAGWDRITDRVPQFADMPPRN